MTDASHTGFAPPGGLNYKLIAAAILMVFVEALSGGTMTGLATQFYDSTRLGRIQVADLGTIAAFILFPIRELYLSELFGVLTGLTAVALPTSLWMIAHLNSRSENPQIFEPDLEMTPGIRIAIGIALVLAILDFLMIQQLLAPTVPLAPGMPGPSVADTLKMWGLAAVLVLILQAIACFSGTIYGSLARHAMTR